MLKKVFSKKIAGFFAIMFLSLSGASFVATAAIDFSDETEVEEVKPLPNKGNPQRNSKATENTKLQIAENNPVAALLCKVIRAFTGTIAKIIAVFLVFGLGIAMLSATPQSPVTPVTIVSVILAIGVLFSAETLIGILTGDAGVGGGSGASCDCKYGLEDDCDREL